MFKLILAAVTSAAAMTWVAVQAEDKSEKPAAVQKAELADNAKNQANAEPVVEALKTLGFKPDPMDTNRIGGAMTFTVNRDVLVSVGRKLNGKTISVGFDGKVTIQ